MNTLFQGMITGLVAVAPFVAARETSAAETVPRMAVAVITRNYRAVPEDIFQAATRIVSSVYQPLGVDVQWNPEEPSADTSLVPRLELRILPHADKSHALASVLGVDAPSRTNGSVRIAHVLYQRIDDDATSAHALGYVVAHLIAGVVLAADGVPRATIVRADREHARRLMHGAPMFTDAEIERLRGATRGYVPARAPSRTGSARR